MVPPPGGSGPVRPVLLSADAAQEFMREYEDAIRDTIETDLCLHTLRYTYSPPA